MSISNRLAPKPPLGWNSWDCYGTTVREDEVKANADYMAKHLAAHGWEYIVVDIQWYEPNAQAGGYRPDAALVMDEYGRLMPAANRFPSAANSAGFKPLADAIHSLGLKFGIHVMRGIPRQAVRANTRILNRSYHAQDIADTEHVCPWNGDMYGIDVSKPGAQAYYDSLAQLYASWDVDYVKADDMLYPYHDGEIAAFYEALQKVDRPMVLSLSPGVELTLDHADHLKQHSELWRISADFWDRWEDLKAQFDICARWIAHSGAGHWADADMLPLGRIGIRAERGVDRHSLFTRDEQVTLMTLWAICRSPLMFGGDLPSNDDFTLSLLTNDAVLALNQSSSDNRELFRQGDQVVWSARNAKSGDPYVALFNLSDAPMEIGVDFGLIGDTAAYEAVDLWTGESLGVVENALRQQVAAHGAKLYRLFRS